jgi:hypothetical protein
MKYKLIDGPYDGWTMISSIDKYWAPLNIANVYGVVNRIKPHRQVLKNHNPMYIDSLQKLFDKTVHFNQFSSEAEEIHVYQRIINYHYYRSRRKLKLNVVSSVDYSKVPSVRKGDLWEFKNGKWKIIDYSEIYVYKLISKRKYQYSANIQSLIAQPEVP